MQLQLVLVSALSQSFVHFLEEEASPGEVRQDSLMYLCILQNGVQPSSFVAYLIFCRVWVCSSASFVRLRWGKGETVASCASSTSQPPRCAQEGQGPAEEEAHHLQTRVSML